MDLMAEIACDEVLDLAYDWLCRHRQRTSHNNDVWDVRWRWAELKLCLRRQQPGDEMEGCGRIQIAARRPILASLTNGDRAIRQFV